MAFSPSDLADDTDFERLVISRLGAARVHAGSVVYDLRRKQRGHSPQIQRELTASVGFGAREELRESLQPLAFGAAYKSLDMLVEHVLRSNGASGRLTFMHKSTAVATRPAALPAPFDQRPELWDPLGRLYVAMQDARHALTHRRAGASTGGGLRVHSDQGLQTDTIWSAEIIAFAAAVLTASGLVIDAATDERRIAELAWHLNQLHIRHRLPLLPDASLGDDRRLLKASLRRIGDSRWQLDLKHVRDVIQRQPNTAVWDLEFDGGDRRFVGRWEDVPSAASEWIDFDEAFPPVWLTEEIAKSV